MIQKNLNKDEFNLKFALNNKEWIKQNIKVIEYI